jgi:tetratricopeptide (TPR) repeat protein
MAGIIPFVLLTFLLIGEEKERRERSFYLLSIYFLVLFAYIILHVRLVGFHLGQHFIALKRKALYGIFAFVYYIRLLIIPYPLRLHYGSEIIKIDFPFVLGLFTVFASAYLIYRTRHIFYRELPPRISGLPVNNIILLRFSLIFLVFSLPPLVVFMPYRDPLLAERFLYFPEVSFAIFIGTLFVYGIGKYQQKVIPTVCLALLLGIYATIDIHRVEAWKNDFVIFSKAATYTNSPMVNMNLANLLLEKGEIEKAIELYENIESRYPNEETTKINYGKALIKQNKFEAALKMYRKALSLNPKSANAATQLGNTLDLLGRPLEAIKMYEYALSISKEFPPTYYNLGVAYEKLKSYQHALDAYKKAIGLNPYYITAYRGAAKVSYLLRDYSQAEIYLKKIISLDGPDGQVYYDLACCYALEGQSQEAFKYLELALKNGYQAFAWMKKDPDLELLRKDQRFYSLLEKYAQQ